MSGTFKPCKAILPEAQQRLWPALKATVALSFVLYGGTAIALRLGHRPSIDFDLFSEQPLNREALQAAFSFVPRSTVLQDERNVLTLLVPATNPDHAQVKVSFFGAIGFGRVGEPELTDDGVLQVASLDDLMASKVKVVLQRAEAKDYRDIAAMLRAGVDLSKGMAAARQLFGPNFQPSESLKALVYFEDGDLRTLSAEDKSILIQTAGAVRELPQVAICSARLTAES